MGFIWFTNFWNSSVTLLWRSTTFTNHKSTGTTISNVRRKFSSHYFLTWFFLCRWKRALKKYLVTYPFVMCCLAFSLWIYFLYYRVQKKADENYPLETSLFVIQAKFMRMIPSAGYSLLIIPMNFVYQKLAIFMTNFGTKKNQRLENWEIYFLENHRLQTAYENNLTSKLFVVYFVNCFVGLFYEAFFNANYGNVAKVIREDFLKRIYFSL